MKGSGIGGQAVMEGVMMKNGSDYAVAVRKPDGEIIVDTRKFKKFGEGIKLFDLPIFRGVAAFIDSLRLGIGTLMYSANFFEDDEPETKKKTPEQQKKEDKIVMTATVIIAVIMAVGIFMILPYFLSQLLKKVITSTALLTLLEGVIRIVLFIGYIAAISCMKDIKRVFMYHGAEHKSINCIEHGLELTVANVRKSSRRHKRCGTSFLLIVMLISVFMFMFIRVDQAWLRIVLRLLLVPVIAGVSYEFIRLAGKSDSKLVNILSKPGLALQGLTTSEPDDSMIEVAIASVEAVFDWRGFLEKFNEEGYAGEACELTGKTGNKDRKGRNVKDNSSKDNRNSSKNNENNRNKNNNGNSQNKGNNGNNQNKNNNSKNSTNNARNTGKNNDRNAVNRNSEAVNTGSNRQSGKKENIRDNGNVTDKSLINDNADIKDSIDDVLDVRINEAAVSKKDTDKSFKVREVLPVEEDEDDEILKALDQYFTASGKDNK